MGEVWTSLKINDDRRQQIMEASRLNEKAEKPAVILKIDFGEEIGIKGSSAQICSCAFSQPWSEL